MGSIAYVARLTRHAQRDLLGVPRPDALRILQRLTEFQKALTAGDTTAFDTRALHGHPSRHCLRLHLGNGDYQAVYTIEDGRLVVWVLASEHHHTRGR
ncbi:MULTISPECIES: type II toxin-antitoxin system RelE/ParE family toxin [unclassified Streptomyces]|uniref:type II toxin-antitoxin system RelE family toxin n=1 Tax=unclassified Streptomyces TaxID=2593676 RepID=UPI00202F6384|nr:MULTISPECIES: type II toxin-antitoxin system RelE/ParE family toxin [unclassified Streptomyces]MCM1969032.1 type II toxin-antitoxin system RelE/ParE family toxin [Streptomyces sp. G1]MCX5124550.1 type II toxin-antitoxin system RelE/ParE family toxin [Streptomyces sp. NBC_00347]MCX5297793.1 type II toxin-antitoxin system RelE/ParE family toxin [Streptomyces sp. NBC_00193]